MKPNNYRSSTTGHTCKALILHCIDFRLQKAIRDYLEKNQLLGDCDIVSIAGGAKDLASPSLIKTLGGRDPYAIAVLQVEASKRLHDIKEIILINHTDCGAYGGRKAFSSDEEEKAKLIDDLKKAKSALAGAFPDLEIKTLLAKISPAGEVVIVEV